MKPESIENLIEKEPKNTMIVVIKPDAYFKHEEIKNIFRENGIDIKREVVKMLPLEFVNGEMYTNIPQEVQFENAKHFSQGPSVVLELEGDEDLMEKVIKITGEKTSPSECDEGTIRELFGDKDGIDMINGKKYYRNAIHRGKNAEEVEDDKVKFETVFIGE